MFCDCTQIGYSSRTCILTTQRGWLTLRFTSWFLFSAFHPSVTPVVLFYEKYITIHNIRIHCSIFRRFCKIAKSDYYLRHVCPSVLPHATTRLPVDGFLWNLIFEDFFENLLRKFMFHWNRTGKKNNLHEDQYTFFYHISLMNEKCFRQKL